MISKLKAYFHKFKVEHKISEGFVRTLSAVLSFIVASMGTMYYKVKLEESQKETLTYQRFFSNNIASLRSHSFFMYAAKNENLNGCPYEVVLSSDIARTKSIATFCIDWLKPVGENSILKKADFKVQLYNVISAQNKVFYQSLMRKGVDSDVIDDFEARNPDLTELLKTLSDNCNGVGVVASFLDVKQSIYENNTTHHCPPIGGKHGN
jgi:hypothetical protein